MPSLSRRNFVRFGGMAAAAMPILTESHFAWAQTRRRSQLPVMPPGAVLINANENPLGPCKGACEAIASIAPLGGRYDLEGESAKLVETFAQQNGLKPEYVAVYAGSSEPLHYTVRAFTAPDKPLITADVSYEAPWMAAAFSGAPVKKLPLTATYAHDVKAMVAASPSAGVLYICNPNNPTGTLTPREDILWALANKPAGSILLVDEAYIHLSSAPSVLDQVAAGKDLVVLRTFSKIYGMAGIRCGFVIGRPDLLAKLQPFLQNAMPITSCAAATASLNDPTLVPTRKKLIADTRNDTFAWLAKNNYKFIPSESNCFMIDTGRPGQLTIAALQKKNVYIGRVWSAWPNHVRVSVGTPDDMQKFQVAFKEVMDNPPTSTATLAPTHLDGLHLA